MFKHTNTYTRTHAHTRKRTHTLTYTHLPSPHTHRISKPNQYYTNQYHFFHEHQQELLYHPCIKFTNICLP